MDIFYILEIFSCVAQFQNLKQLFHKSFASADMDYSDISCLINHFICHGWKLEQCIQFSICNNVFHEIAFEVINFDDKKTTFNFTINNLVIESGSKSEEVE